jgi:hypothetical protein
VSVERAADLDGAKQQLVEALAQMTPSTQARGEG